MKHISILITICALFFAQMAHAANEVTRVEQDGITYRLYDDNTAIMWFILEPQNIIGDIVLPGTITHDGTDYTLIEVGGFLSCTNLTGVTIPNSVSTIGNSAFRRCSSLTSVTIPSSVTTIEDLAFDGCSSLASVTIPNSVSTIGVSAFYGCSSLTSITIPNSVSTIGNSAFYGCSSLTSVAIPNLVSTIGEKTFDGCSKLTSVTIPNSVSTIGDLAFGNCSSLTSVTIPNSVSTIGNSAFRGCSSLTSVTIPNSVSTIENGAFDGCSSLASVTIPNSVSTIGVSAFNGCSSLTSITIPNSVFTIGNNAFEGCKSLTSVTIPNSVSAIGNKAFYNCSSLQSVTIGAFVQSIGEKAFANCGTLTEMTFYSSTPPNLGNSAISNSQAITVISSNRKVYYDKYLNSGNFNLNSFVSFEDSQKCVEYFNAIIEAITHAANRVPLSDEDNAALEGYMTNMTTVLQEFNEHPNKNISDNYKTIFDANEISAHKVIALAGIRQALPSDGLLEEEQTVVNDKIARVNSATTLPDIYSPQNEAIDYLALHPRKISALAAIEEAMQGNTDSKYLNDFVKEQVATIKNATDAGTIANKKDDAIGKIETILGTYLAAKEEGKDEGKASAFGTLGTKQNGPALIVTDKDGKEIILYSPKSVEYIKVNEE